MNGGGELAGNNMQTWARQTCRAIVMRQQDIEAKLRTEQHLEAFLSHMARWREEHLNQSPFQPDRAALALYGICQEFGLVVWLEEHSPGSRPPVRGAQPRTRGATLPGEESLESLMNDVAKVFGVR